MGLASALSTALTGLSAAETQIDVIGNNLANSQTVGFKASDAVFATQFLQSLSLGSSPTDQNGGTNPRQIGLGVQVSEITPDFSQGTIEISSSPSDLAIQGDGFFIVEGAQNEQLYTRNGIFKLNSENQLTTATGQRLLGFGVDDLFRVQQTQLEPIEIPLGSESVAKATNEITFEGTLTPNGAEATVSQVIESAVLGDALVPNPDTSATTLTTAPVTDVSTTAVTTSAGGTLAAGTYQYRFVYTDTSGREAVASSSLTATVNGTEQVNFASLPASPSAEFTNLNVYRTDAGGSDFFLLDSVATGGAYVDTGATALSTDSLNEETLSGNYTYMVTYYKAGNVESRPSALIGPQNVVNGRVVLDNFPAPPVPPPGGGFPDYDEIRIYRNLANDQNSYYRLDTIAPGETYTDSKSDAEISDLTNPANQLINLDGPTINSNTLLTNVLKREGLAYEQLFTEGTLTYQGEKGERLLGEKQFEITNASTIQDLIDFIEQASGIQSALVNASTPIPSSENNIPGESGVLLPGGYIQDGAIRFVSNTGEANALEIDLTAFQIQDSLGNLTIPNLSFGVIQEGAGTSAVSDFVAYDSLGVPLNVRVTATLEEKSDQQTVYRWYADSPENQNTSGSDIAVGTGLIRFDGNGNFVSVSDATVSINRTGVPSVTPLQFELDFTNVSGLATETASLAATRQDGSAPGVLTNYTVGEDGVVRGVFSNGVTRDLGQIQLARFANPAGLDERGNNLYAQGINTGLPVQGGPGENGIGSVIAGALELSNTDIGADLVDLVLAGTQYRGNTRVITTSQQLLDELLNLRR